MSALFSQALRRGATVLGKSVGQSMFRGVVARPTSLLNPAPTFPVASGRFAQPTMRHLFVSTAKGSNGARNWVRGQRWIPAGLRRGSVNILAVRVATKAGCKGGPVVAKAKTPLSTILWRCLWVPYFLLAFIPHSFLAATIYHALRGNHAKSRGWAFYTVTGYICLPLSMVVNLSAPFVYLFDWDRRLFFNYMTKLWGKITTYPFVVPKIIGAELIPQDGRKMVLVSNHQSWLDIFCMCWLPDDVILRFISKVQIAYIPVVGWSMALLGHVLFDRSTGGKQLLTDCAGLLAKYVSLDAACHDFASLCGVFADGVQAKCPLEKSLFRVLVRAGESLFSFFLKGRVPVTHTSCFLSKQEPSS